MEQLLAEFAVPSDHAAKSDFIANAMLQMSVEEAGAIMPRLCMFAESLSVLQKIGTKIPINVDCFIAAIANNNVETLRYLLTLVKPVEDAQRLFNRVWRNSEAYEDILKELLSVPDLGLASKHNLQDVMAGASSTAVVQLMVEKIGVDVLSSSEWAYFIWDYWTNETRRNDEDTAFLHWLCLESGIKFNTKMLNAVLSSDAYKYFEHDALVRLASTSVLDEDCEQLHAISDMCCQAKETIDPAFEDFMYAFLVNLGSHPTYPQPGFWPLVAQCIDNIRILEAVFSNIRRVDTVAPGVEHHLKLTNALRPLMDGSTTSDDWSGHLERLERLNELGVVWTDAEAVATWASENKARLQPHLPFLRSCRVFIPE